MNDADYTTDTSYRLALMAKHMRGAWWRRVWVGIREVVRR